MDALSWAVMSTFRTLTVVFRSASMLEMASIATALDQDLKIRETPIRFALRHAGESKTSARIAFQYLVMLFACRKVRKKLLKENR